MRARAGRDELEAEASGEGCEHKNMSGKWESQIQRPGGKFPFTLTLARLTPLSAHTPPPRTQSPNINPQMLIYKRISPSL